jgi:hypothetical protein
MRLYPTHPLVHGDGSRGWVATRASFALPHTSSIRLAKKADVTWPFPNTLTMVASECRCTSVRHGLSVPMGVDVILIPTATYLSHLSIPQWTERHLDITRFRYGITEYR